MAGQPLTRERRRIENARADQLAKLGLHADSKTLPTPRRTSPETWRSELDEEVVALGACGLSQAEIAAHWSVPIGRIGEWRDAKPTFAEALLRSETQAMAWWESKVRDALNDRDNRFPVAVWISVMKARFPGYQDRLEINARLDLRQLVMVDLREPTSELETIRRADLLPASGPVDVAY